MRPKHNVSWPVWAVCALTAAAALALWPLLPARIPMHWNIDGAVDGWGPRHSVLYIPLLQLALCALMALLPRIDPLRRSYTRFLGAYQGTRLALALFLCAMEGTVLLAAFYPVGPWAARRVRLRGRAAVRHRESDAEIPPQLFLRHPHAVDARGPGVLAAHAPFGGAAVVLGRPCAGRGLPVPADAPAGRGRGGRRAASRARSRGRLVPHLQKAGAKPRRRLILPPRCGILKERSGPCRSGVLFSCKIFLGGY